MSDTNEHDLSLVANVVAQRPGAFDALTAHLAGPIDRCLDRLLRRWPEARAHRDDLRQELAVHLVAADFRVLRSYRGDARLSTWIHAVATRHFYRRIRRIAQEASRTPAAVSPALVSDRPDPEQQATRGNREARVRGVLAALPEDDQLLVGLLFEQELTAADAGLVLGIAPSGVRMRKKRLLARLAVKLKGLWP